VITKSGMNATHKGIMYGFVPVFVDMTDRECPAIEGRNFLCDLLLDIVEPIYFTILNFYSSINPEIELGFKIKLTEELD
jgi:hypothetical protein